MFVDKVKGSGGETGSMILKSTKHIRMALLMSVSNVTKEHSLSNTSEPGGSYHTLPVPTCCSSTKNSTAQVHNLLCLELLV